MFMKLHSPENMPTMAVSSVTTELTNFHMLNEQSNMRIMSFTIRKSRNSRRISRCYVLTIKSFYT